MKNKILQILSENGDYVSGEYMSSILGITRNTVWKYINALRSDGYVISSSTNKGYKLVSRDGVYSSVEIKRCLNTEFLGKEIYFADKTDSTNVWAKNMSNAADGSVFVSEIQTNGRGRLGRAWESEKDGVWFTLLLKPQIPIEKVSLITLVAGIALCRAIGDGAKIKWPNDIIISGKKVCGILTEMSSEITFLNYVVCGIGINLNNESFPDELLDKATSVYLETGKKLPKSAFLARVLYEFEVCYKQFLNEGFESLLDEYKKRCITLGNDVMILQRGEKTFAKAVDITDSGELVIIENGVKRNIFAGEVSVRGLLGYS